MALNTEALKLLDFALASLPGWFSDDNRFLDIEGGAATINEHALAQVKYWLDTQAHVKTATGATLTLPDWLNEHARDRGTSRTDGETDASLIARLITPIAGVTPANLISQAQAIVDAGSAAGAVEMVELRFSQAYLQDRDPYATGVGGQITGTAPNMAFTPSQDERPLTVPGNADSDGLPLTGNDLSLSISTTAGNDGVFPIDSIVGDTIYYQNATGVAESHGGLFHITPKNEEGHATQLVATSYLDRGYRAGSLLNRIILIAPYGTTDEELSAIDEMLRIQAAGGVVHKLERNETEPSVSDLLLELDLTQTTAPAELSFTRASGIYEITGSDDDGLFAEYFTNNEYTHCYQQGHSNANKRGLSQNPTFTGPTQYTRALANSPNVRFLMSFVGNQNPGFVRAQTSQYYSVVSGSYVRQDHTTVIGEKYTASICLNTATGGTIKIIDTTGPTTIATHTFSPDAGKWQRPHVSGIATSTSTRMEVEFNSSTTVGTDFFNLHPEAINGSTDGPMPPYAATTTPVTTLLPLSKVVGMVSNNYLDNAQGEIFITYVPRAGRHPVNGILAGFRLSNNNDFKWLRANNVLSRIYSGAGAIVADVQGGTEVDGQEFVARLAWDATSSIDGTKCLRLVIDGVEIDSDTGAFTSGTTDLQMVLGNLQEGITANSHYCSISNVRIYGSPQAV